MDVDGYITAISADGSVVAGTTTSNLQAWRFKKGESIQFLSIPGATKVIPGYLPRSNMNHEAREVQTISANGSKIVGVAQFPDNSKRAFYWDADSEIPNDHILLPAGPAENALRIRGAGTPPGTWTLMPEAPIISADGLVVVGLGRARRFAGGNQTASAAEWPFSWTAAGGTSDFPNGPFNYQVFPQGISGDGSTIIALTDGVSGVLPHSEAIQSGSSITINPAVSRPTAISYNGSHAWGTLSAFVPYRWQSSTITEIQSSGFAVASVSDDGAIATGVRLGSPVGYNSPWTYGFMDGPGADPAGYSLSNVLDRSGITNAGLSLVEDEVLVRPYARAGREGTTIAVDGARAINKIPPLQFASLGDSYSSGEGVRMHTTIDYGWIPGTNIENVNTCHNSLLGYPRLVTPPRGARTFQTLGAQPIPPSIGIPGWEFQFNACSGAETKNIHDENQQNRLPQASVVTAEHDLITLTIGGNDAFFGPVVEQCMGLGDCFGEFASFDQNKVLWPYLDDHIRGVVRSRLVAVYSELKSKAPNATIVAINYPLLFPAQNKEVECPGENLIELLLTPDERAFLNNMTRVMNQTISSVAKQVGIHYLDVTKEFMGHDICSGGRSWLNGVTRPRVYSFHPKASGQKAIARALQRFLDEKGIDFELGFSAAGLPNNPAPSAP